MKFDPLKHMDRCIRQQEKAEKRACKPRSHTASDMDEPVCDCHGNPIDLQYDTPTIGKELDLL